MLINSTRLPPQIRNDKLSPLNNTNQWPYFDQTTSSLFAGYSKNESNLEALFDSDYGKRVLSASIHKGYEDRYHGQIFEEAFVSFFKGEKYAKAMEVIIDAVNSFSDRPILVFIDIDRKNQYFDIAMKWHNKYGNVILFEMPSHRLNIWFDKLRAIILAPVNKGVIVEADTIITPDANRLFFVLHTYNNRKYPIAPQHADIRAPDKTYCLEIPGVNSTKDSLSNDYCQQCCLNDYRYPWRKRGSQYRHAHIMWKKSHRDFIAKILYQCLNPKNNMEHLNCYADETALNDALWNVNATFQLCMIDPSFKWWNHWKYLFVNSSIPLDLRYSITHFGNRTIGWYFHHGQKDLNQSWNILNTFKQYFGTNLTKFKRQATVFEAYTMKNYSIQPDQIFQGHGIFGENCVM